MTAELSELEREQAIAEILENAEQNDQLEYIDPEELAYNLENSDELDLLLQAQKELNLVF